jgi:hypothetical protein
MTDTVGVRANRRIAWAIGVGVAWAIGATLVDTLAEAGVEASGMYALVFDVAAYVQIAVQAVILVACAVFGAWLVRQAAPRPSLRIAGAVGGLLLVAFHITDFLGRTPANQVWNWFPFAAGAVTWAVLLWVSAGSVAE